MDVGKRLLAALQEGVAGFVNSVAGISTRCALKKLVPDVKHSKSQTPFPVHVQTTGQILCQLLD